jgi:hypothetical protein
MNTAYFDNGPYFLGRTVRTGYRAARTDFGTLKHAQNIEKPENAMPRGIF